MRLPACIYLYGEDGLPIRKPVTGKAGFPMQQQSVPGTNDPV
ncbi:hypothetical protein [Paenibacillus lactis]